METFLKPDSQMSLDKNLLNSEKVQRAIKQGKKILGE